MKKRLSNVTQLRNKEGKIYYKPIKYPNIPLSINDLYIITTSGDRLDLLANQFYKDVRLWWIIATANRGIVNNSSFGLKTGLELRIPQDVGNIIDDFNLLNKNGY